MPPSVSITRTAGFAGLTFRVLGSTANDTRDAGVLFILEGEKEFLGVRGYAVVFGSVPNGMTAILDQHYKWMETFKATVTARISSAVYDQQDAFYVPFANLDAVRRPGPDVHIYERLR